MYAIVRVKLIMSGPVVLPETTKLIKISPSVEIAKDYLGLLQLRIRRFNNTVRYNSLNLSIELTQTHPRGWDDGDTAMVQYQIIKW